MNKKNLEVQTLIAEYAAVYSKFEKLQGDNKTAVLPVGDQKTGVIGEYYAKKYIEHVFNKKVALSYEKSGELFDLVYKDEKGKIIKVQVKVVSAHSKTRTISKLKLRNGKKPLFHFLYLIALDLDFKPCGFWINSYDDIARRAKDKILIQGSTMKGISAKEHSNDIKVFNGSKVYNFNDDKVKDLLLAIMG